MVVTLASALAALPLCALAQQPSGAGNPPPQVQKYQQKPQKQVTRPQGVTRAAPGGGAVAGQPPQGARVNPPGGASPRTTGLGPSGRYGPPPQHNFHGYAYRGHLGWERGRWRHEAHNGRLGWWWDVGGVWYFYPERVEGPPLYVSEVEFADPAYMGAGEPVVEEGVPPDAAVGAYPPPPGPPGYVVAYPPPPPPPPPPGQPTAEGAIGGAILGGILGGVVSGRPGGALAGALIGGATGAAIGSEAERRRGYYWWRGGCYYRYPSGEYAAVPPGYCQ
jgi:hypothetical protein